MKTNTKIPFIFTILIVLLGTLNLSAQDTNLLNKVRDNDLNAVKELIAAGADVNMQDDMMGYTPLILSIFGGHKEMAELLLSKGADINAAAENEKTPLSIAAEAGDENIVEILKSHGAK